MSKLKGVILGVEDVLLPQGKADKNIFGEVCKLIEYFKNVGVEFAVLTNRTWVVGQDEKPLEEALLKEWGDFPFFCRDKNKSIPAKQSAASTEYVCKELGWEKAETAYIGASDTDMQAAVNGGLLFLRATWWADKTDYGFNFDSPKDIARFIDSFCLRDHLWCHQINDGKFQFYALAPYSTYKAAYTLYSEDARAAAKHGLGHPDFWVGALVSSLYFSGICHKMDYICVYPGHQAGSGNSVMNDAMDVLGKCFRANYIPDLILRHTTAQKSQAARNNNVPIDHLNQLNTICLNKTPQRTRTKKYAKSPLKKNKTVLMVDDICTRGYSLESGRAYIEQTGASVIMAAWLKTINTDISVLKPLGKFNPYNANTFASAPVEKVHSYGANIVDHLAPSELNGQFQAYEGWDWPS